MKFCRDDLGMAADKSSTLFLFIGFFAAAGRILAGILCDFRCVNSLFLLQGAIFVSAASILSLVVVKTYPALASVVVLFSLADGLVVSTSTIELLNCVKESERASSLGFCLMGAGVFMICSPPLSGKCFLILRLLSHGAWLLARQKISCRILTRKPDCDLRILPGVFLPKDNSLCISSGCSAMSY